MKNIAKVLLAAALLFSSFILEAREQKREMEFEKLWPEFVNPDKNFRAAPLWVWNTRVATDDIDRMLGDMKEAGFGGAFIHPRPGLITDYLSDEWFALYKYSVEKGKQLGLDIWIYDENSYPSGFAGGHVPAEMPESYNGGQGLVFEKTTKLPENAAEYFLCLKKEGELFKNISGETDRYTSEEGEYYLYKKTYYARSDWHGGFSYVDLLYPGVTEKFIDVTMSGYEKTFGKELGTVIKGVFSDEPNIGSIHGIRWTPDFFDVFEKQWGYDLRNCLPMLVEETGDWRRVRHNYMETLTQLFIDRWSKPMSKYCEKKNLKWTGHYWEHGWPNFADGGDNMAMYAWHQMPAIDMLFNQYNDGHPQAQFGNARAVKELSSVANQLGYVRTLSETYGGGGWDESFEDFKRLGDWEYALGVNFMNQHLAHMTIVGARKYDYPPVFTRLSPWWDDYKTQNDYFGRLSLVLSQGEQINDILVLEPTTSAWMYFSYVSSSPHLMDIGSEFQNFVTELEKKQAEYDLGSENIIKDRAKVDGKRFKVGRRAYHTVVLPPGTENINSTTFGLLKKFVKNGGRLVTFATPKFIDGKESEEASSFFSDSPNVVPYSSLSEQALKETFANDNVHFDIVSGNDLYHHRRTYKDGELLFLANASLTDSVKGHLSVIGKSLTELDAMSGKEYAYPATCDGMSVIADFAIPPGGSLLLFASPSSKNTLKTKELLEGGKMMSANSALKVKRMKANALPLDFCDLTIDGKTERNLYTVEACNKLYRHFGMSDPWNSAIQYRQTIVERDTFTTGNIKVAYYFTTVAGVDNKSLCLIAEQPEIWKVKVNGTPVESSGESFLDARFGTYAIGHHVKEGVNRIELSVSPMSIYAEIAPVYIIGNFTLESAPYGWIMQADSNPTTGSWKDQGLPCYSWDMAYSKKYVIDNPDRPRYLSLGKWNGTVAEVFVNGKKTGVIAYKPYRFDLTPYLEKGENEIEVRVVGSLHNLFGPHYSAEKGINGPWDWNGVQRQAPGNDYNLIDYGLMEDFSVFEK